MASTAERPLTLADVSEDELLERIFPVLAAAPGPDADVGRAGAWVSLGPGDDTALGRSASGGVLATTDAMVRGPDWRDDWSSGSDVGHKIVAQNVADIAAMGGVCTGLLVTLIAEVSTPLAWVLDFTSGLAAAAADAGTAVVGGDLSSAPAGTLAVSVTALGDLGGRAAVRRSGARLGDVIAVAGSLGRSGAGLELLQAGRAEDAPSLVAMHLRPRPPYEQGPVAAAAGASAMIDLSDGLVRDAGRVAKASGVRMALDAGALRGDIEALAAIIGPQRARECVLTGGEEHSLLACFPPDRAWPAGWRRIGLVEDGGGVTLDGEVMHGGGWDHFAG